MKNQNLNGLPLLQTLSVKLIRITFCLSFLLINGCQSSQDKRIKQDFISSQKKITKDVKRPFPKILGNTAENTSTIKIGLITSQSGPLSAVGTEIVKSVQLSINEFNQYHSIKGKKIELIVGDSGSRPEQGKTAAEWLVSKGVIGLIGDLTSGITAQIARVSYEKGVPQIAIGATRNDLTDIGANFFRICYNDDFQGRVMATFAYKELNLSKVAVFTDLKEPYSVGLSHGFIDCFKSLGGNITDQQFYESGQTDFNAQLTHLKQKSFDGLFIGGYYPEVGPIIKQATALAIDVHKLGGDGWECNELRISGGKAILGSYFCTHCNTDEKQPILQQFIQSWKKKFLSEVTTNVAALAFDSANLMIDALKRAKKNNSYELLKAINHTVNFKGVTGNITFLGMNGNPKKRAIVMKLVSKGRCFQKEYSYNNIIKP